MIFFVLFITVTPLVLGHCIHKFIEKKKKGSIYQYLLGVFSFICFFQVFHMAAIKLSWNLNELTRYFFIGLFIVMLVLFLLILGKKLFDLKNVKTFITKKRNFSEVHLIWGFVVVVFLLQCGNFFLLQPYLQEDITRETVLTSLHTNTIYQYHPLTGKLLTVGMTPIGKLNSLPILYSVLVSVFRLDVNEFLFRAIPVWVLFMSYAACYLVSDSLLKERKEKKLYQAVFLLLFGILGLFGDYSIYSIFYRVSHEAWAGTTMVIFILVPFVLDALLEKKYLGLMFALVTSVCVANPGEGLFLLFLIIVLYVMSIAVLKIGEVILWKKQNKS